MIDTPNMSYCQFENTTRAIDQLITNMQEAIEKGKCTEFVEDMNQYEREAFETMVTKITELQEMMETMYDIVDLETY